MLLCGVCRSILNNVIQQYALSSSTGIILSWLEALDNAYSCDNDGDDNNKAKSNTTAQPLACLALRLLCGLQMGDAAGNILSTASNLKLKGK